MLNVTRTYSFQIEDEEAVKAALELFAPFDPATGWHPLAELTTYLVSAVEADERGGTARLIRQSNGWLWADDPEGVYADRAVLAVEWTWTETEGKPTWV